MPGIVIEFHIDQNIPRKKLSFRSFPGPFNHFKDLLLGHQNLTEELFLTGVSYPLLEIGLHLLLIPGVCMYNVPMPCHNLKKPHILMLEHVPS
jgi:hypothetical protein